MLSSSAVLIGALIGIANAAQPTRTPTRGPTIMPSRAPSVEPTIQPSEAPTQWPTDAWGGWATTSFYTEEDELLIVTGKKTESCIPKYQGTSDVIEFNYKINCGDAVMKFYYYDAADTNCEGEVYGGEPYVETDLYGEFENGLQIGRTRVSDIVYYQLECSPLDAPFSFAPVAEDNSTLYYATEMLYPEVEDEADRCATEEMNVFTSYLENRCFHYTMYTPVVNSSQWEGSEYSGKFVSEWSPSEDIRFKRYVGGSCSDWHSDPVVSNLKVINQCNALRGQDEDESSGSFAPGESTTGESTGESTTGESTGVSTGESTGVSTGESTTGESTGVSTGESTTGEEVMSVFDIRISHLTHTLLDTKVERAFAKAKAAKSATAADKQVQEDFSSTYTYAVASGEDTDFINVDDETDVELTNRGAYSMWVNTPEFPTPTAVPTVMPSHPTYRPTPADGEPTAAPTHQEAYTFSAWMTLKNIDQATWYQKQSNSDSFVQAVAANMHSMNPDAISFGKVRNVHNSDERKLQLKSTNLRTLDESSSEEVNEVKIDFQVSFVLATVNYHNITDAYDELTGALYDGVIITGLFDHLLQSYSADNGGSLDYVKSVDVGFGEPETWDMTREEHPKNTHSGLIVGVIIGLGVGLSCIAGMYYWVFYASA